MTQPPKPSIRLPDEEVERLIREETDRVNQMIRSMPKRVLSFRISAMHHLALSAFSGETGLTVSEVIERFVMAGLSKALDEKELPAVEDYPAVPFGSRGQDEESV